MTVRTKNNWNELCPGNPFPTYIDGVSQQGKRYEWFRNNCEAYREFYSRDKREQYETSTRRKRKYGLTVPEHKELRDTQPCQICSTVSDDMVIDHNHNTGSMRGVLCRSCNTAIGLLKDSPQIVFNALNYLYDKGCYGTDC